MGSFRDLAADVIACLRFYTRAPIPVLPFEHAPHELADFSRAIRVAPIAGAAVGCAGAAALLLGVAAGMPSSVTAALTLAALTLATGAFHEDGLADTADGLGGGATRERKLEIMRDSRVGSYGAMAIGLSLLIRWAATAALVERGVWGAVAALVFIHAASRGAGLLPLALLEPARAQGAAFAAARPAAATLATAWLLSAAGGILPVMAGFSIALTGGALVAGALGAWAMAGIARRLIGGQTGDIAGAAQQIAEMAMLCVMSAHV